MEFTTIAFILALAVLAVLWLNNNSRIAELEDLMEEMQDAVQESVAGCPVSQQGEEGE